MVGGGAVERCFTEAVERAAVEAERVGQLRAALAPIADGAAKRALVTVAEATLLREA